MSQVPKDLSKRIETDPTDQDVGLRGRTYAIPFDDVWEAAAGLADGGLRGWRTHRADDQAGVIEAIATTRIRKVQDDIRVKIGLDENGQTRVDLRCWPMDGRGNLKRNRRRLYRFFSRLDRSLNAGPSDILDPTAPPSWRVPPA